MEKTNCQHVHPKYSRALAALEKIISSDSLWSGYSDVHLHILTLFFFQRRRRKLYDALGQGSADEMMIISINGDNNNKTVRTIVRAPQLVFLQPAC